MMMVVVEVELEILGLLIDKISIYSVLVLRRTVLYMIINTYNINITSPM